MLVIIKYIIPQSGSNKIYCLSFVELFFIIYFLVTLVKVNSNFKWQ